MDIEDIKEFLLGIDTAVGDGEKALGEPPYRQALDEATRNLDLESQAKLFVQLRDLYERADAVKSQLGRMFDDLRVRHIPERMDDLGLTSAKVDQVGTVILTDDLRVKTINKRSLFDWLEETNNGDVIQESVNASTLKALLRRTMKSGGVIPADSVEITPFTRASIRKR